jgi:hypothetical protein
MCLGVRVAGKPAQLIEGYWFPPSWAEAQFWSALVSDTGQILDRQAAEGYCNPDWCSWECTAIDFDADSTDEIACIARSGHHGVEHADFELRRIVGHRLERMGSIPFAYSETQF